MGMAASSLRFAQLTARKNQVEFEGQQINQQRLTLSQKSSAIYNDMLTKQVPTAPDPSQFTKIVYKFNNGGGTSSILNLAKKTSGAYNYNITYKRPKTTNTLSKSSFSNVGFSSQIGVTGQDKTTADYYARTATINGVPYNLSLVGGNTAAERLQTYKSTLETYQNMKTIEEQISSLSSKKATDTVSSSTQQSIKSALGLDITSTDPTERNSIEKALFGETGQGGLCVENPYPEKIDLSMTDYPSGTDKEAQQAAYNMAVALGITGKSDVTLSNDLTQENMDSALSAILADADMSGNLKAVLTGSESGGSLTDEWSFATDANSNKNVTQNDIINKFSGLNELARTELANLLAQYAKYGSDSNIDDKYKVLSTDYTNHDKYENYGQAANSLYSIANGDSADETVTNEQMIAMLEELLKETSKTEDGKTYQSSGDYKTGEVDPAFVQYQSSVATPGIQNIGEGQILYEYADDNGEKCYMYVSVDNILDDKSNTYADSVQIYENSLNYLDGEYETEQQDANVIMSEDGQVVKITFADGTVVAPEIVTEMDDAAYDQAMVEYEYKKEVYDKEMNDANAKVKIIQAQDQKLEVRLKQLDTEQKAIQTEIDAVKSVRDKAIESSFKTFS